MKKQSFLATILLPLMLVISACTEKKIEYFKLSIVYSEPISQLKENDPLPSHLISLINYYEDTACEEKVFVPEVSFERTDITPTKKEKYVFKLTGVNEFRKSCDLLSAVNLKEDYDANLSSCRTPKILTLPKTNPVNTTSVQDKYPNVILVSLESYNLDSINVIRSKISDALCSGKISDGITIMFVRISKDSVSADSALSKFNSWKNEKLRSTSELDSTLQKLERDYPNDYRFTLERLKIKNEIGEIKESDEYLLLLAVEKAIKEGKAKELLAIINKMRLPKPWVIPKAPPKSHKPAETIPEPTIPLDKKISFRKQNIETKLSTIADNTYSRNDRRIFKEIALEDFESPSAKVTILLPDTSKIVSVKNIDDYLNFLRFTKNYSIKYVASEKATNGKIISIKIIEIF